MVVSSGGSIGICRDLVSLVRTAIEERTQEMNGGDLELVHDLRLRLTEPLSGRGIWWEGEGGSQ